jgi:transcription elongation factor Elf1
MREHYFRGGYQCKSCSRCFSSDAAREQHRDTVHYDYHIKSNPRYYYSDEGGSDSEEDDVIELYRSNAHSFAQQRQVSQASFECLSCSQTFYSFIEREQHRKAAHPDDKKHECPYCHNRHVSASAVIMHLESGGCRSQANRQCVDEHIFSATSRTSSLAGALVTRNNAPKFEPIAFYRGTEESKNSKGYYECYFCPGMEFRLLKQLNQHLESPKHSNRTPGFYKCPTCGTQTQTLSGLTQHAEMGSCGLRRDSRVKGALESLTNGMRQISI